MLLSDELDTWNRPFSLPRVIIRTAMADEITKEAVSIFVEATGEALSDLERDTGEIPAELAKRYNDAVSAIRNERLKD